MKKRLTTAILAAIMLAATGTAAAAAPAPLLGDVKVDPVYTVVIPEGISLGNEADSVCPVKIYGADEASNVVISNKEYIAVSVTGSKNGFNLVSDDGEAIAYTVNGKNDLDDLTEVAVCNANEKTTTDIVFTRTSEAVYSGNYTDKLEFTVSLGSRVIDVSQIHGAYTVKNNYFITGTANSDTRINIEDGATVTLEDCDITSIPDDNDHAWAGITFLGDGTLVLEGTNKVKSGLGKYPGIKSAPNKTLTITGSGSLNAIGQEDSAGIGGGSRNNCGNIEILGGNITPTGGGVSAPGIGSGYGANCGTITISGGSITAEGGLYAAAIGNGYEAACGDITISGGTVNAKAGNYAAAIGTGYHASSCGNILLSGGSITAIGGTNAAAVGSGQESTCHNITVRSTVKRVEVTKGGNNVPYFGKGGMGTLDGVVTIEDGANVIEH